MRGLLFVLFIYCAGFSVSCARGDAKAPPSVSAVDWGYFQKLVLDDPTLVSSGHRGVYWNSEKVTYWIIDDTGRSGELVDWVEYQLVKIPPEAPFDFIPFRPIQTRAGVDVSSVKFFIVIVEDFDSFGSAPKEVIRYLAEFSSTVTAQDFESVIQSSKNRCILGQVHENPKRDSGGVESDGLRIRYAYLFIEASSEPKVKYSYGRKKCSARGVARTLGLSGLENVDFESIMSRDEGLLHYTRADRAALKILHKYGLKSGAKLDEWRELRELIVAD